MQNRNLPTLDLVEFYVTNVCNYNCEGCNRFNNYYFKGHKYWDDYKDIYKEWSKKINFKMVCFDGGETTLNPKFMEWVYGVRELWPETTLEITTNGSRLEFVWDELYNFLINDGNAHIKLNVHDADISGAVDKVSTLLKGKVDIFKPDLADANKKWANDYNALKDDSWPNCDTMDVFETLPELIQDECLNIHDFNPDNYITDSTLWVLSDNNGATVKLSASNYHHLAPILKDHNGKKFTIYNSNPEIAFSNCNYTDRMCQQMNEGKLYICAHFSTISDFEEQFEIDMSIQERNELYGYKPLTVNASPAEVHEFVNFALNATAFPECKFCPEQAGYKEIHATLDKVKLPKKKSIPIDNE